MTASFEIIVPAFLQLIIGLKFDGKLLKNNVKISSFEALAVSLLFVNV